MSNIITSLFWLLVYLAAPLSFGALLFMIEKVRGWKVKGLSWIGALVYLLIWA